MTDLISDIKSLELETIKNLKNSKSNNTIRAYESDFKDFSMFCLRNNFKPLPTDPKVISIYLTYLSKKSKFSTLKRRIASIKVVHKIKELDQTELLLQIHDEIIIETKNSLSSKVEKTIISEMEKAMKLDVPLFVNTKVSESLANFNN